MTHDRTPGFGTMTLTGGYGIVDRAYAASVLRHAVQQGAALVDTADAYVGGEELVASVRAAYPEHPFRIVTKIGLTGRPGERGVCGRTEYLSRACETSLRRLHTEQLDVLLLHRVDPEVPIELSMSALADLVNAGKVAEIGLCTSDPQLLRRAAAVAPVAYVETALSVLAPTSATSLLSEARELGVVLIAASPLGRGLVAVDRDPSTLPTDDARAHVPEIDSLRRSRAVRFRRLANRLQVPAVALALGWVSSLGGDVIPIPGARSKDQVNQNLDAQRRGLSPDHRLAVDDFINGVN